MDESCVWDGSLHARNWILREIPGWVMMFNEVEGVLSVKTETGERYVPWGYQITRHDNGTVTVERPDA